MDTDNGKANTITMTATEAKTPLFLRTYSKVRPTSLQKPKQSPVFPGDKPKPYVSTQKWINIPTGSSPVSDNSEESNLTQEKNNDQENASDPETFVSFSRKKQSKRRTSTPLINLDNILANKPRFSIHNRVASPFQQKGTKQPTNKPYLASIFESDIESTSTDEEYIPDNDKHKNTRSRTISVNKVVKEKTANIKPKRKFGWPGFNLMIKGKRVLPVSAHLAAKSRPSSQASDTSGTTEDLEDTSDDESVMLSEDTNSETTLTEPPGSEENTLHVDDGGVDDDDDEIEVMRDFPEGNALSIRGKKAQMVSKSKQIILKNVDPIKLPLDSLSLDASTSLPSSKKQVSFLLCSKEKEELPDREIRKGPIQLPQPKTSILKKTTSESGDISFSSSFISCSNKMERMSSTPTRAGKKNKMMQLSFDVSAVHLPSYDVSDLVVQGVKETKQPTQHKMPPPLIFKEARHPIELVVNTAQNDVQTKEAQKSENKDQTKNTSLQQNGQTSEDAQAASPVSENIPVEATQATPRSQLKRNSPESHIPVAPSKRKPRLNGTSTMKDILKVQEVTSSERQRKRLEYEDKAVGPPDCCITKLNGSTCNYNGVKVMRCATPSHKLTYKQMQQVPTDVLEVLFS